MNKKAKQIQKNIVRVIALVLALLLVGSAVFSIFVYGFAEELPDRDAYELTVDLYEEEQALQVSQRLVYTNRTGKPIENVMFYLYGNMLRRESALVYDNDDLGALFPAGYAPGSIEFSEIRVNGAPADWAVQGEEEMFLRVSCPLEAGQSAEFRFDYIVLLPVNNAFLGVGETDWRLSGFFPAAAGTDSNGDFVLNAPLAFARTAFLPEADYCATITLPAGYDLAAPGAVTSAKNEDGSVTWRVEAAAHDFALSFGRRWRTYAAETPSGTQIRLLANDRSGARKALDCAAETLACFENWFGVLPSGALTIAQSDYALSGLGFDGMIWLSSDLLSGDADELRQHIRYQIARQYFGFAAYVEPNADAWLTDSISMYAACLALEESEGNAAYLKHLNREIVPALQLTLPGGLEVTSAAHLFDSYEYKIVVLDRGTAVFHELRTAMGRENLIAGLRAFYELGRTETWLGEYDLVAALDSATGGSWEAFLTDWLFNIDDYVEQEIEWLD